MAFWVICPCVQGGTTQTLKGERPAIISTTSLDSNLSFLHQKRPLEQMDSFLIVLPWLYFSTSSDSSIYSLCWTTIAASLLNYFIIALSWLRSLPFFLFFTLRFMWRYDSRVRIRSLPLRHVSLAITEDFRKVSWVCVRMGPHILSSTLHFIAVSSGCQVILACFFSSYLFSHPANASSICSIMSQRRLLGTVNATIRQRDVNY